MTELTLIFVFHASGILLSLALARLPATSVALGSVRRIVAAIERAGNAFLARAGARLAFLTLALACVAAAAGAAYGKPFAGVAAGLGVVLGASLAALSAWVAATVLTRANGPALAAAGRRFDATLATTLAAGGAAGILAQTLGVLGAVGQFLLWARLRGGAELTPLQGAELVAEVAASLPGYALGAALTALVAQASAAAYRAAADGGLVAAARHERALSPWDPRNPALVSALVAGKLESGARAALLSATSAAAASVSIVLATRIGSTPYDQTRIAALPLVLLAFGLVASAAGVWVARALEAEGAAPALLRGQTSAAAIWLLGLGGACHWLFPECWLWLIGAGALGLFGGGLVTYALSLASLRTLPLVREAAESLRAGPAPVTASALAAGLAFAGTALAFAGAVAIGARALGIGTGLPCGAALGLSAALAGALSLAPFAFAVEGLALGATSARAVGSMSAAEAETARRVARLADSSQPPAALARSLLLLGATLPALASCLVPGAGASPTAGELPAVGPLLGWLSLLGAGSVFVQAGAALRRSARAARELTLEVERQLASVPLGGREAGREASESGATSYRACEELCGRIGLSAALPLAAIGALGPVLLGSGLLVVYRMGGPRLAADALAMFVAGAAVTALGAALTVDGAHAVLAAARRASRPEADPATFATSVTGDALLGLLQNAIGPTVCSLALIAASFALLLWPLLP